MSDETIGPVKRGPQRVVLDEIRAWEDRKMVAESERRGAKLILPPSSPAYKGRTP